MRKIYFRADASSAIGYGHFIRTLALADMLKDDFNCTFFTCHPTPYQVGEMEKVCPHVTLQEEKHYDQFLSYLQGDEIVVLDNYFFTTDYQRAIKQKGCHLVCIDDMHDKHYVADVVINHGQTNELLFDKEPYTELCLGLEWAMLRSSFLDNIIQPRDFTHWVIAFGGSDIHNLSLRYATVLQNCMQISRITVVVGDAYKEGDEYQELNKVSVVRNLPAERMAKLFRNAGGAVVSCSTISIEALSCRCPVYAGYYIDNQQEMYECFLQNNYIVGLGSLLDKSRVDGFNIVSSTSLYFPDFGDIKENYKNLFLRYANR